MTQIDNSPCLVVYFDIFGFSRLIEDTDAQKRLTDSLLLIWDWIHALSEDRKMIPYLFSDGGYLLYPVLENPSALLSQSIQDISLLQDKYFEMGFVIRGAVSIGPVTYSSRLLVGTPVVNAYQYETHFCPAPFVIFPRKEIDKLVKQNVLIHDVQFSILPSKQNNAILQSHIIFPSDRAAYIDYVAKQAAHYTINGPFEYGKLWFDTLLFLTNNFEEFKHWRYNNP
jgi:hypothetical protein